MNEPVALTQKSEEPFVMRVKSSSDVRKLASALYYNLQKYKTVVLRTLGAGPTQQAVKSIAIASGRCRTEGHDLIMRPCMHDVPSDDGTQFLTALSLNCSLIPV